MQLQTNIPIPKSNHPMDYHSKVLLLGSCFVENIGQKLNYFKFQSVQNPFGILFHPLAIENLVARALHQQLYTKEDLFYSNEQWHCFDAHSDLNANSEAELLDNLNQGLKHTFEALKNSSHIIITLGTAWAYHHLERDAVVANCHKIPQSEFSKELLSIKTIEERLSQIITSVSEVNPKAVFLLTVSPVRHLKDGFVENQRSKAHLISAVHRVVENFKNTFYFPSYELVMDELRDYRFYTEDMIHPNTTAVNYIWNCFQEAWISEVIYQDMKLVDSIQKGLQHRPFNPKSESHQQFLKKLEDKIKDIQQKYRFVGF